MYVESARRLFTYYEARNGAVPSIKTAGLKLKRQTPAQHDRGELTLEAYRIPFANAALCDARSVPGRYTMAPNPSNPCADLSRGQDRGEVLLLLASCQLGERSGA